MGIFFENVCLVNRAPVNLSVMFDGQSKTLVPGDNLVPEIVVPYAKNQNPIMGSADPHNPHISGGRYLVGVKMESGEAFPGDEIEPLTEDEWNEHLGRPCREDETVMFAEVYGNDPKARLVIRGKGRKSTANSRAEVTERSSASTFSGRE